MRLHVCADVFDFSDPDLNYTGAFATYSWAETYDWSSLSPRTVYLSLPANNARRRARRRSPARRRPDEDADGGHVTGIDG